MQNAHFFLSGVSEFESDPFDVVILSEVLEHVSDPKELLLAAMTHLKASGIVIVTVPNGYGEFEIDSWIYRNFRMQVGIDIIKRVLQTGRRSTVQERKEESLGATDNVDCGHVQFFRRRTVNKLFAECSLSIATERAGALLCGPIICHTLARSRRFIAWNARISDNLPLSFASSWYFVLRRVRQQAQ
jgi:SAM-dependent methyltransferase